MTKMMYSFMMLKTYEVKDPSIRKQLTLWDIFYMSIPAILNAIADKLFFYLQTALNDELVIQAFGAFEVVIIGIASYILLGRK